MYAHNEITRKRIVFFGSGDFPVPTFRHLLSNGFNIVGLVTSNDSVFFNETRLYDIAYGNGIPVYIPDKLDDSAFIEWLSEKKADIFCVISYKILPDVVINLPRITSFNVHASLLPFLKGPAPIYWAIARGLDVTGLTSFILDRRIDGGDIILNKIIGINKGDTYGSLHQRLSLECAEFTADTISVLDGFTRGRAHFFKQPPYRGTVFFDAPKIGVNDRRMGKNMLYCDIMDVYRKICALSPNIGMNCEFHILSYDGTEKVIKFKIYEADLIDAHMENEYDIYGNFGQLPVMSDGKTYLYITSKMSVDKVISLKKIQVCGKRKVSISDFLNGFRYFRNENRKKYYIYVK